METAYPRVDEQPAPAVGCSGKYRCRSWIIENRRILNGVLFLYILISGTSCASLIMGPSQSIDVHSEPAGAHVYVNGVNTGKTTPTRIRIKRKAGSQSIKFERDGFEDHYHSLERRFNWLVALDFFYFAVPGIIDVAVGAQHLYDKTIFVKLNPEMHVVPDAEAVAMSSRDRDYSFLRLSDVDVNIPAGGAIYPDRYALIVGNEDYSSFQKDLSTEVNVAFARNDASAFREYAEKMLGIPERNITFLLDATSAEMRQGIAKLNLIAKNSSGKPELFVFYAGHGLPDEKSQEPYLMPVDVSGKFISLGLPVKELYHSLTEYPTKRTTVFLDACFSGGARNQGLLAARGVRIKPKNEMLKGQIIVFSASSEDESALPYSKKNHGLFTYYLLQKLKETGGDLTYEALSEYLEAQVPLESVIVNDKEQHPKTNISPDVIEIWPTWKFR